MRTVWKPIPLLVLTVLLIGGLAACQILVNPIALPQEQAMAGNATIDATLPGETATATAWLPYFNEEGALVRPDGFGFREEWVYIGTPLTPNELNNGRAPFPEFHNVYMEPRSYAHFKATGEVLEGTMVVKELLSVGDTMAPSGNGYFMGDFLGLEVAMKSAEHFPDEPGNWAYFSWTNEEAVGGPLQAMAMAMPTESCNSCHRMFAAYDQIFVQYYPILRAANPAAIGALSEMPPAEMMAAMSTMMAEQMTADPMTPAEMEAFVDAETLAAIAAIDQLPRGQENLLPYLQEMTYTTWLAESATHPSTGPHGYVRSYMNGVLADSITAGNAEHPTGAAVVKELYARDAETLIGWAAYVKTQADSADGDGWYWYENFSTTDNSEVVADGNGVPLCVSCHGLSDIDYVLSIVPFE
ncbi:MAG TPA: cytochrome P460 family protein [Caldilineaceae bacterium]|nr:cytochrome P460 family protein [Caldilineaceae bacterium]